MTSTPALVIFDCDGVLVDSEPVANRVLAETLSAHGHPITTEDAAARFTGLGMCEIVTALAAEDGPPLPPDFVDRVQGRTFAEFRRSLRPIAGVADALRRITLPVCVASNGAPDKIALSLALTGLAGFFPGRVFDASMVARGKPAPHLFLHAARSMGAAPAESVVVEDSTAGVAAGLAAGMRVLGYAGAGNARALAASGAEVFQQMADLPALVAG